MVYIEAWGIPCFEKVENVLKLFFKVSANDHVLLHIGQKGSGVCHGYCPLIKDWSMYIQVVP
jgi:hypothetical protein